MFSSRGIAKPAWSLPFVTGVTALVWVASAAGQATIPEGNTLGTSNGTGLTSGSTLGSTSTGTSTSSGSNTTLGGATPTFRGTFNGNSLASQSILSGSGNRSTGTSNGTTGVGGGMPSAFSAYYVNPLAAGAPGVSQLAAFNAPIYNGSAQGGGSNLGSASSFASPFANGSPFGNNGANLSPNGAAGALRRGPSYTAVPAFAYRPAAPNQVQRDVAAVLARSTALSPDRDIQVVVEGPVVVLRGTVSSEADRRLAESLVRLSPGVQDVRNELQMPEPIHQPRPTTP